MKPILEIQHIAKKFRLHHQREPYLSIRDSLSSILKGQKETIEEFYALRDVSFNVFPGESLGILGRNGAGKSTLLKILSKITPPTSGKIISRGRIASLLEVGTGFHSELTGRENIYLNGSILGMKSKEIQSRFDEIVDFSSTERFLDTPLKHYSSGMQLRLAFAVAAFLEPEILIIDEVLAVGDAEFQKKCIGKMESVSKDGRTILFVSHNLSAISNLCSRAILLSNGVVDFDAPSYQTISRYLEQSNLNNHFGITAKVFYETGSNSWERGEKLKISFEWEKGRFGIKWSVDIAAYSYDNSKLFALESNKILSAKEKKDYIVFEVINPGFLLNDIRIDFGIKLEPEGEYALIVNNILKIHTGIVGVPQYARNDAMIVPEARVYY